MRAHRHLGLVLFGLLTGVASMSDEAQGQERKETKVKITVKSWDKQGKKFLKPQEDVDARKVENKGRTYFFVSAKQAIGTGEPTTGSEITDADGTVYVVTNMTNSTSGEVQAAVKKKP